MAALNAKQIIVFGGASLSVICCVFLVWWSWLADIDPVLEKACHKAVAKSTPFDVREFTTLDYVEGEPELGIAHGHLETRIASKQWAEVAWTCRVNPRSGQIFRAEVKAFGGAHRLNSAAAPFSMK
ncbi:MAG: hypothetical protein ACR2QJ_14580 [Geminicoccaceae bacterium]